MTVLRFANGGTITVEPIDDPICDVRIETRSGRTPSTGSVVTLTMKDAAALIAMIASAMYEGRRESEGCDDGE